MLVFSRKIFPDVKYLNYKDKKRILVSDFIRNGCLLVLALTNKANAFKVNANLLNCEWMVNWLIMNECQSTETQINCA